MDACPDQNAKKALKALEDVGAFVFKIALRSPDLNPIKKSVALVTKTLRKQVIGENIARWTNDVFTAQIMKISIKDFFSKCNKIRGFLRDWWHLLKKSWMENFIFWAVICNKGTKNNAEVQHFKNW